MSKARWIAASYALTLTVGALLWVILRSTGEPRGRAIVIAAILVLAIFSFGLAAMWIRLTISRSSREDRPFGVFLAFVRILQGRGFLLILWTYWLGVALFSASIAVDLVGRRIARRYLRVREASRN